MTRLADRLCALERRHTGRSQIEGLDEFYRMVEALAVVGGAEALLARKNAGETTPMDVEVLASIKGGAIGLRDFVEQTELFWPSST